jgi:hypothetical protein
MGCTGLGYGMLGKDAPDGVGGWISIEFFRQYAQEGNDILGVAHERAVSGYITEFIPPSGGDIIDTKTVQEWVLLGDPSLKIGGYS